MRSGEYFYSENLSDMISSKRLAGQYTEILAIPFFIVTKKKQYA